MNKEYQKQRIEKQQKFLLKLLHIHIGNYYPLRKYLGIDYKGKIDQISNLSIGYNTKKVGKKYQQTRTYQSSDLGYKLNLLLDKIPQLVLLPALLQPTYGLAALAFFFLTQTTYQPSTKDTWIYKYYADTNYGTETLTGANYYNTNQLMNTLIHFDTSDIPNGATFSQGDLILYACAYYGGKFYMNRMTRTNWTEDGATWNKYDGTNAWTTAGGDFTTTNRAYIALASRGNWTTYASETWSSAQLIQDCYDNQSKNVHLLISTEEVSYRDARFYSKEHATTASRPKLTVTYTVAAGPANLKSYNGLAIASMKSIMGLGIADVKSINGLE